jgi:uncharacterized protein (TIGR04255 family)
MRRQLPALKLRKSPLVFVLAQVKFSPVLSLPDHVQVIQEVLRKGGYPRFEQKLIQDVVLGPEIKMVPSYNWVFSNRENTQSVVLSNTFMVLQTSAYDRFDPFIQELEKIMVRLNTVLQPDLVERIGLRYIDAFQLDAGETLGDYLQPGLAGFKTEKLRAIKQMHGFEVRGDTEDGQYIFRLSQNTKGQSLPMDLAQHALQAQLQFEVGSLITILDFDHFSLKERDFDSPVLAENFWQMHHHLDCAFKDAITSKALKKWDAEPT